MFISYEVQVEEVHVHVKSLVKLWSQDGKRINTEQAGQDMQQY